jgi:hypothetical protein
MKFNENFIGYEKPNTSIAIDGIIYKYNKLGHRCKNIDEINLENYILFAGCSHTEGEGLHIEHTYPYLTAKELNADYYNLGIRASGFDVLFYNVMSWLALYPEPKLVVIQYPDPTRFAIPVEDSPLIVPIGPWRKQEGYIDFLLKAEELGLFSIRNFCNNQLLNRHIKSPLVKLVFGGTKSFDSEAVRIEKLDYAVDNIHYGIETHEMCAEIVSDKYHNATVHKHI